MAPTSAPAAPSPLQSMRELWGQLPEGSLWAALFMAWAVSFRCSGFDQVYLIFSMMACIFGPGLSHKVGAGRYSAYSIFNEGGKHLMGDLRAEQLEAEQRGDQYLTGYNAADNLIAMPEDVAGDGDAEVPVIRSRDANRPCPCGSGKKAKRCCFDAKPGRGDVGGGSAPKSQEAEPDPLLDQWRAEFEVTASGEDKKSIRARK